MLALVYLVAKNWFGIDIPSWADISSQILAILAIVFDVVDNPTDKGSF
ncbi:MAG: hypothetical protein Q8873_02590 [Bacillota bacterium]|nr:hypothetical protein [Bacillota bacterium]